MILQKDKPNIFIVFIINNHDVRWEEVQRNSRKDDEGSKYLLAAAVRNDGFGSAETKAH